MQFEFQEKSADDESSHVENRLVAQKRVEGSKRPFQERSQLGTEYDIIIESLITNDHAKYQWKWEQFTKKRSHMLSTDLLPQFRSTYLKLHYHSEL
jgi:hypothetical protein